MCILGIFLVYCGYIYSVLWAYFLCIVGVAIEEVPPIRPCWQIMGTKATSLIITIIIIPIWSRWPSTGWAKVDRRPTT